MFLVPDPPAAENLTPETESPEIWLVGVKMIAGVSAREMLLSDYRLFNKQINGKYF